MGQGGIGTHGEMTALGLEMRGVRSDFHRRMEKEDWLGLEPSSGGRDTQ